MAGPKSEHLDGNNTSKETSRPRRKGKLRENIEALVIAVILALFIRTFVVQAFKIPSGSMKQTLQIGDHILVNKFIYGVKIPFTDRTLIPIKTPERGDIVVFKFPNDPSKDYIKRVIGVAGDTIQIRNKRLYVNGRIQNLEMAVFLDPNIIPKAIEPRDNFGPATVPESHIFVMGDNRDHSFDSRFWGFVDLKLVKGMAFMIYWSWNKDDPQARWGSIRWGRIGKILE